MYSGGFWQAARMVEYLSWGKICRSLGTARGRFRHSTLVGFCALDNLVGISAYGPADCHKLRNVEATLAQLELGHERLPLPETLPKFHLRYAGFLPSLHQQFDHSQVEVGSK